MLRAFHTVEQKYLGLNFLVTDCELDCGYSSHNIQNKWPSLREMSCVVVLKLYDTDPYFWKIRTYREVPRGTARYRDQDT